MARRRKWEEDELPPPQRGLLRSVRSAVWVVLALLLILYLTVQAASRTEGFRDLVGQRLEARLGLPVKIEGSHLNWRLDLTLENLVTEGTRREDSPGLRARRIHLAWAPGSLWRGGPALRAVELDRCVVVFGRTEEGDWAPAAFRPLSELLGRWLEFDLAAPASAPASAAPDAVGAAAGAAGPPSAWGERYRKEPIRFRLTGGEVSWWDGGPVPRATVQGVEVQVTPVRLPGRPLIHLRLAVGEAQSGAGEQVSNLGVELLDAGERQFLLGLEAERRRAPRP